MMAPGSKQSRIFMVWGNVSATTVAPRSAADGRRRQLMLEPAGIEGRDPEDVPVDGSVGQERQRRHEIDLVLAEPVEASGHDELERRAAMRGRPRAECFELGPAWPSVTAPACRHRRCGWGPGRSRSRALLPRASGAATDAMAPTWSSLATVTDGVLAHHDATHRRVADEEAGVDRRWTVEPAHPVAERAP